MECDYVSCPVQIQIFYRVRWIENNLDHELFFCHGRTEANAVGTDGCLSIVHVSVDDIISPERSLHQNAH